METPHDGMCMLPGASVDSFTVPPDGGADPCFGLHFERRACLF